MRRETLNRLLITSASAIIVAIALLFESDTPILIAVACTLFGLLLLKLYKFDYLHPAVAYLLPWTSILIFSVIPISIHARPMDVSTYVILLSTMFAWLFGCAGAYYSSPNSSSKMHASEQFADFYEFKPNLALLIGCAFAFLYAFAALNVALAGFVPILSLVTTGDSRYLEFGVPSVYGAFLAYSNALACVSFYAYLRTHRRIYQLLFLSVFVMHIAFITRQNLITLVVEAFVIRSFSVRRLSRMTVIWSVVLGISAFSLLGSLRSGNVKEIFGVEQEYDWLPPGVIWVYAYSYFNALNLDNLITQSEAPYFDGSMLQTLLPSFLRPESSHQSFTEVASAAASSYIFPVYTDIGKTVVVWTGLLSLATASAYRRALRRRRFVDVANYSCLFFCALLSFFTDFWLYLPVIFQLFFFRVFQLLLFKPDALLAAEHGGSVH